ncbi:MAG: Ig-like domain repeat protein, partial [Oxalobacteraceae bacterium]
HWPLAFPDVMVGGGFDVVLGNPPWERIKLQEQEFFAGTPAAEAANAAARTRMIDALGTAEPGSTVTLYDGSTPLGTAVVAQDGTWSFTSGILAEGLHQITASDADLAGNLSPTSQVFALTVDTTSPMVTAALLNDTGSSASDRITADPTLTGSGDANALVTIRESNLTLGTTIADGQGHWIFAPQALPMGVHNLTVSETDAAGNIGTAQVSLRLDSQSAAAPTDFITVSPASIGIARFFDTAAGTQFFTSSLSEYNAILANRPDLKPESNDLNALNPNTVATDPDAVPVYRFFDTTYGTHFFTASTGERDDVIATRPDLKFEGVGFFEHTTQQAGDTAVYRFFDSNNGTHFYTTNETERASIVSNRPDLTDEGIGFYAPKTN